MSTMASVRLRSAQRAYEETGPRPRVIMLKRMARELAPHTALQRPQLLWPRSECGEAPDDDGDDGPALFTGLVLTAVSPDRRLLLLSDGAEGHYNGEDIGLWDVARGRWRARLLSGLDYHGEAYCGIFSPDSRRVFAAPVENMEVGSVIAWSTAEGRELWCRRVGSPEGCEGEPPPEQRKSVRLAVSGNGRVLAAMSQLAPLVRDAAQDVLAAQGATLPGRFTRRYVLESSGEKPAAPRSPRLLEPDLTHCGVALVEQTVGQHFQGIVLAEAAR